MHERWAPAHSTAQQWYICGTGNVSAQTPNTSSNCAVVRGWSVEIQAMHCHKGTECSPGVLARVSVLQYRTSISIEAPPVRQRERRAQHRGLRVPDVKLPVRRAPPVSAAAAAAGAGRLGQQRRRDRDRGAVLLRHDLPNVHLKQLQRLEGRWQCRERRRSRDGSHVHAGYAHRVRKAPEDRREAVAVRRQPAKTGVVRGRRGGVWVAAVHKVWLPEQCGREVRVVGWRRVARAVEAEGVAGV